MRAHPVDGVEALKDYTNKTNVSFPDAVYTIVRSHQEKLDGNGYPDKLKGEEIPFLARLSCICDQLISRCEPEREYREKEYTLAEAFSQMSHYAGIEYDGEILSKLGSLLQENKHLAIPGLSWLGSWQEIEVQKQVVQPIAS